MLASLWRWIEKRNTIRRAWQSDAGELIERDEANAYLNAQRLAARARASGDRATAFHWAKVASEVARLSPAAEMDWETVKRIAREEDSSI